MSAAPNQSTPGPPQALTSWRRRPLSGLRWQLTFLYSVLLSVLIILFGLWITFSIRSNTINIGALLTHIEEGTLILIALGTISMYFITGFVLRPLRLLSDAAQTITLGDLQQRARLIPLLQKDDEVGKLAASLNAMVDQLEQVSHTQETQTRRFRRLFSDASHQLRTPLTSLRGFTEVLMRGAKDDPETMKRVLRLMNAEAERMTHLINDILTLARLDDGSPLPTEKLDLVDIAVEAVEHAKVLASDERHVILSFITDERLSVQANADRLKQVLHILIDNAFKYGRPAPDGWIRLQLDRQNGQALLQIIDNGDGIDPVDLPHIFDHFYRGIHIPTYDAKTPPLGTGLGLTIALSIIHAHQGDITVHSEPKKETSFTVKLPCSTQ